MNPPVTSSQGFPLRTQVNLTHQTAMTMEELCQAWNEFHPRYSNRIPDLYEEKLVGTFKTRDGRSVYLHRDDSLGIKRYHWKADDGSEFGGQFDVWELETDIVRPTKKQIEYLIKGEEGFEISRREKAIGGRPYVETYIRRIRLLKPPSVTDGAYHEPIISAIPVILDEQQDSFTYNPDGGGTRWRLTHDTFGFTQDGITGIVKTNFGSGSYQAGEGRDERRVAWSRTTVFGELLTRFRTHYIHDVAMREAELPRGSRPENDGFGGNSDESERDFNKTVRSPNSTGRILISIDPVDPNIA